MEPQNIYVQNHYKDQHTKDQYMKTEKAEYEPRGANTRTNLMSNKEKT